MEMNFCRRCGKPLTCDHDHVYLCPDGHVLFANASTAVGILFVNDKKETLAFKRALNPGKGKLDMGGGFCDGPEPVEDALEREILEEVGLTPGGYEPPQYLASYIDPYEYKGEKIPVLFIVFWSRIKPSAKPKPADDVEEVIWMPFEAITHENAHFPSYIEALEKLAHLVD